MGKLFGTDGVRGIANAELTAELAYNLGRAGSYVLARTGGGKPLILVGKDTRISCDMLEAALVAGICSTGADVVCLDILPTPAIAFLVQKMSASCGIVISASHNPVEDNGIKFFGPSGYKLPDETEEEIENLVLEGTENLPRPIGENIGRVSTAAQAEENYLLFLQNCVNWEGDLSKLTIVLDCANGAAYKVGPEIWKRLGAKVIPINHMPNGININKNCGSTNTDLLKEAVVNHAADLGIAYDGDADRCIAVDEKGNEVDGDHIMLICATHLNRQGLLKPPAVVATVMSNIGFDNALRKENIEVISCKVGDRYVLEKMKETGAIIGGEQSGHIIFLQHATTGDGILTSLKLVEVLKTTSQPLSVLASQMKKQPQLLVNVRVENKEQVLSQEEVKKVLRKAEEQLGEWGKLVVRPSGTEPFVRIMAQGPEEELLTKVIDEIRAVIEVKP
ncbi:MAG: phosphoglucosamine mutase [Syntrophomonadaceae bacterium]|jgi:phosphoglucosamine mutase